MDTTVNSDVSDEKLNTNQLINNLMKQLEAKDHQMEQLNQTIANLTETINELKRKIGIIIKNIILLSNSTKFLFMHFLKKS